jgi:hypothetical protein|tara:strand:- start:250 stop:891 length:642 start_codon:yes stop_codon:yes gene_type:complete
MGLSKTMKTTTTAVNKNIGGLFTNKYFLYFMLFLAITSILGYLQVQNFHAIIFFMLIGFLTFQFCKNMSIVLLTSIIATSLYVRMQNKNIVEGLVNKQADDGEDEDDDDDDDDDADEADDEGMSSKIDYKKTLTDSYDNLNKMIGNEGMQKMTKDTERLMDTQKQLAKNMENMKPMLENAQNMIKGMGGMDIKGLGNMMNQLGGMGQSRGKNN